MDDQGKKLPPDPKWREREQRRLDGEDIRGGNYTKVPWWQQPWHDTNIGVCSCCHTYTQPDHFVHMNPTMDGMVRYIAEEAHGVAHRYTITKPGRYLKQFHPKLSDNEIEKWAAACKAHMVELKFAYTPDEMQSVYERGHTSGCSSCMSYPASYFKQWGVTEHPVRLYAAGDLAVAYIEKGDGKAAVPVARCLCWPEKKRYGRRYGDHALIEKLLQGQGYSYAGDIGGFAGAKLRKVKLPDDPKCGTNRYLCTSIDLGHKVKDIPGDDEHLLMCTHRDAESEYGPHGAQGFICRQARCDLCRRVSGDGKLYAINPGPVMVCNGCLDDMRSRGKDPVQRCFSCHRWFDGTKCDEGTPRAQRIVGTLVSVLGLSQASQTVCGGCAVEQKLLPTKAGHWISSTSGVASHQCTKCSNHFVVGTSACCEGGGPVVYWRTWNYDAECYVWSSKERPVLDAANDSWVGDMAARTRMRVLDGAGGANTCVYIGPDELKAEIVELNNLKPWTDDQGRTFYWVTWRRGEASRWYEPGQPLTYADSWTWPVDSNRRLYPERAPEFDGQHNNHIKYVGPPEQAPAQQPAAKAA